VIVRGGAALPDFGSRRKRVLARVARQGLRGSSIQHVAPHRGGKRPPRGCRDEGRGGGVNRLSTPQPPRRMAGFISPAFNSVRGRARISRESPRSATSPACRTRWNGHAFWPLQSGAPRRSPVAARVVLPDHRGNRWGVYEKDADHVDRVHHGISVACGTRLQLDGKAHGRASCSC
jgi:hypothetical protein